MNNSEAFSSLTPTSYSRTMLRASEQAKLIPSIMNAINSVGVGRLALPVLFWILSFQLKYGKTKRTNRLNLLLYVISNVESNALHSASLRNSILSDFPHYRITFGPFYHT